MSIGTVILVPGFCGSSLSIRGPGRSSLEVWLCYSTLTAGGWRWLAADHTGRDLQPGLPLWEYYGTLASYLGDRGWAVQSARQDWRLPLIQDAYLLCARIREISSLEPVHLVGHSRGGLVMRAALAELGRTGELARVGRCVGIGVPHQGSLAAAALLAGWDSTALRIGALLAIGGQALYGGWPRADLDRVIRTWSAVYQLLPRPTSTVWSAETVERLHTPQTWIAAGIDIDGLHLLSSRDNWTATPEAPASVPWTDIAGFGADTPLGVGNWLDLRRPSSMLFGLTGDGAVPTVAAHQAAHPFRSIRATHDGLVYNAVVLSWVDELLRA